jgi:hypothetical protein
MQKKDTLLKGKWGQNNKLRTAAKLPTLRGFQTLVAFFLEMSCWGFDFQLLPNNFRFSKTLKFYLL